MKFINKHTEYLNESLGKKVFHFTEISKLVNILDENMLQTTTVMGTGADASANKDKLYFLSTTSSRHSEIGYASTLHKSMLVRLNLNGDKLNQNHKGSRVDYWQRPKDPKDPMYKSYAGGSGKSHLKYVSRQDELEDRLMTDKPVIKNAHKYIDSISVLFDETEYRFEYEYKKMYTALEGAKELNIDIYFYNDQKAFDHELTDKAVDITKLDVIEPEEEEVHVSSNFEMLRVLGLLFYADSELRDKLINGLSRIEEFQDRLKRRKIDLDKFVKDIDKQIDDDRLNYLFYVNSDFKRNDYRIGEFISVISNDIHNAKSKPFEHRRYITHELSMDMKKHDCKNIVDYIRYKVKLGQKESK